MRRSGILGACVAASLFVGTVAQAATIEPVQGNLSVNQGQGFQRVNTRVDANVGDSVMVGPGGSANVVYSDGCTVNVQPGSVVSISALSPCASGSLAQDSDGGLSTGAIAGGALFALGIGLGVYGITQSQTTTPAPSSP